MINKNMSDFNGPVEEENEKREVEENEEEDDDLDEEGKVLKFY